MRVLTYSRFFPAHHPRKGEPTHFVDAILAGLKIVEMEKGGDHVLSVMWLQKRQTHKTLFPKFHTIREGKRWKPGDWFSARYWSGLPYRSKQVEFAQIEVKKVWSFKVNKGGQQLAFINSKKIDFKKLFDIARNDGLEYPDFSDWLKLKNGFVGQIICWNDKIEYTL